MLNVGISGGVAPLSEVSFFSQKCHLYDANKPGANFTNILWAAFAPKSFHQKITNPNCKHFKAAQRTLVWLSISPIFYKQLFHTKVLCAPFMRLKFGFVIFWQKDFGAKAAHKMLVKLTPGSPCCRGRFSTTGLLVLTIIDLLLFLLNLLLSFCTKQATLMRRSTVLSLPLQLVFPVACTITIIWS